jgi:ABC-type Fe3+-siderophore transport system permease subunit
MPAKGQDMQTSIYLAKLIGPFALVLGLALALNRTTFRTLANEFLASPALIFVSGVITFVAGLAILIAHHIFPPDWRVLITLLGLLAFISGIVRMLAPQWVTASARRMMAHPLTPTIAAAIYIVVGAILCFYGYRR